MPLDVKISKRKLNFTEEKKEVYVASADRNRVIETDKIAGEIAVDTGARPAQVKMILNTLTDRMMAWLEEGHGVRFGKLGSFLPSVRSKSGDTADEATVKRVRIAFYPSKELSDRVAELTILAAVLSSIKKKELPFYVWELLFFTSKRLVLQPASYHFVKVKL